MARLSRSPGKRTEPRRRSEAARTNGQRPKSARASASPPRRPAKSPRLAVVAVGASAGGVEATQELFGRMPLDSGIAFVLHMHLDPTRETQVDHVIATHTELPVVMATHGMRLEPNRVHVAPPAHLLTVRDGTCRLRRFTNPSEHRLP